MNPTHLLRQGAAAVLLCALSAGCTSTTNDAPAPGPVPTGTGSPTATATTASGSKVDAYDDPHQQAIDAYLATQQAYLAAAEAGDPDHPDLSVHTAGRALDLLRDAVASLRDRGLRGRGEATYQPQVDQYDDLQRPTTIIIRDCMDTTATELYAASGQPYQDQPGGLRLVIATVEIVDATWKVTGLGVHGVDTCER